MNPTLPNAKLIIDEPLQLIPGHRGEQGSALVTPSELQDHSVWVEIDSIFVAAIKPHTASSWDEGHVSTTVAGRFLSVTVVKHKGAHVTNGLEPESQMCKLVNTVILHKLDGTVPIE